MKMSRDPKKQNLGLCVDSFPGDSVLGVQAAGSYIQELQIKVCAEDPDFIHFA